MGSLWKEVRYKGAFQMAGKGEPRGLDSGVADVLQQVAS